MNNPVEIPMQAFLRVPLEALPAGPQGKSAYQTWLDSGHTGSEAQFLDWLRNGQIVAGGVVMKQAKLSPGANTANTAYVCTGLQCQIDVPPGKKVRAQVAGMVNHTGQNIVHFTLKRDGVDLAASGDTGLACARIDIADGVRPVLIDHIDTPPVPGVLTYELWWRCHNAGTAYLGRRPADAAMMVPTVLTLTIVEP